MMFVNTDQKRRHCHCSKKKIEEGEDVAAKKQNKKTRLTQKQLRRDVI